MKNKRKSKNKYRAKPSDEEVKKEETAREELDLNSNKSKETEAQEGVRKKGKNDKAQKRKSEGETVIQSKKEVRPSEKKRKDTGDEEEQPIPEPKLKPELSREQSLKREKLRKLLRSQIPTEGSPTEQTEEKEEEKEEEAVVPEDRSASLRSRMEQRLDSARFRYINEVLYSTSSGEARRMFKQDPQAFWIYHRGYTAQVQRWPNNPVDAIVNDIRQR